MRQFLFLFLLALLLAPAHGVAQEVNVIEHELDNGLTLLLVPTPGDPNVAAGLRRPRTPRPPPTRPPRHGPRAARAVADPRTAAIH